MAFKISQKASKESATLIEKLTFFSNIYSTIQSISSNQLANRKQQKIDPTKHENSKFIT